MFGPDTSDEEDDYFGFDCGFIDEDAKPAPKRNVLDKVQSTELRNQLQIKLAERTSAEELFFAVENSDLEAIERLLQSGVSVDTVSPLHAWTPLKVACSQGKSELVLFLLQHEADPNKATELHTPLMACNPLSYHVEERLCECVCHLLEFGANPNARDKFKMTSLMYAAKHGYELILRRLLAVPGIDINAQDKEGWTALFYAVDSNNAATVELLVEEGCDLTLTDQKQCATALDLALLKNSPGIPQLLGYVAEPADSLASSRPTDPLEEFFSQLPDEDGNGGFSLEVQNILQGVGLEALGRKLSVAAQLPDFLNMTDEGLLDMGVKMASTRRKILEKGIHRYHLQPWKKSAMYQIRADQDFGVDDAIHVMSNILKHLTIVHATLRYLGTRVQDRIRSTSQQRATCVDLVTALVDSHVEVAKLHTKLDRTQDYLKQFQLDSHATPADYVGPEEPRGTWGVWRRHAWPAASTVLVACFLYYIL